jgi:hypothetical protein
LLDEEDTYLWPETTSGKRAGKASKAELVELYPFRSAVHPTLWWNLFGRAQQQIDVLVYAANFLHEQFPALNDLLSEKAAAGCKVRVALGDPDCEVVKARGEEECFGHGIETRCRVALMHYRPLIGVAGIDVRLHRTTLTTRCTEATTICWSTPTCGESTPTGHPSYTFAEWRPQASSTPTPPALTRYGPQQSLYR